jgi:hypothetical protein
MLATRTLPAHAQETPGRGGAAGSPGHGARRPVADVLAQMAQSAGVVIVSDSTAHGFVSAPSVPTTPENVEEQLTGIVSSLPGGMVWAKLYLPAPASGRWNGDIVAEYVRAQAQLVGTVGAAGGPAGTIEVLGRAIPAAKANEYIAALNLKQVYLVASPNSRTAARTNAGWLQMTDDQRQEYAQAQAQQILAMDPASRAQALGQMMAQSGMVMKAVISQMSPAERDQMLSGMSVNGGPKIIIRDVHSDGGKNEN